MYRYSFVASGTQTRTSRRNGKHQRAHLEKKTGIRLSESPFRALLRRNGYRYRRPKQDLGHLQDKKAKSKAFKLLEELTPALAGGAREKRSSETISSSSLWTKQP